MRRRVSDAAQWREWAVVWVVRMLRSQVLRLPCAQVKDGTADGKQ
ncbi:unannotated protein [freshwater metagenome]|uniref:Unannotated protein n=1 Tax=freshwater metagenome TaxID=449393 RepID=A0A6J6CVX2_9ZZZZ